MYRIIEYQCIERCVNVSVVFCCFLTCDCQLSVFRSFRVLLVTSEVPENLEEKLEHSSYAPVLRIRGSATDRDLKPSHNS